MAKKIAVVVLQHTCDENPCHLENESQSKWLQGMLPLEKIKWNWNLYKVTVYDLAGKEGPDVVSEFLESGIDEVAD